jgi:hypothetical protein
MLSISENDILQSLVNFKIIDVIDKLRIENERLAKEINEAKETIAKLTAATPPSVRVDSVAGIGKSYFICGSSATVPDDASVTPVVPMKLPPGVELRSVDSLPSVVEPSGASALTALPSVESPGLRPVSLLPTVVECQFCLSSHLDGECVYQLWLPVLAKSEPEVRPVRKFIRVINKWVIALPKGSYPVLIGTLDKNGEVAKLTFEQIAEAATDPDVFCFKTNSAFQRSVIEKTDPELDRWLKFKL